MNAGQAHRIGCLGAESVWKIPDGSWLAVRRDPERGTWIEVIDPTATGLLAWDMGDERPRTAEVKLEAIREFVDKCLDGGSHAALEAIRDMAR